MDDDYYSIDSILAENQVEYSYLKYAIPGETEVWGAEDTMQIQARHPGHGPFGWWLRT